MAKFQIQQLNSVENVSIDKQNQIHGGDAKLPADSQELWANYANGSNDLHYREYSSGPKIAYFVDKDTSKQVGAIDTNTGISILYNSNNGIPVPAK